MIIDPRPSARSSEALYEQICEVLRLERDARQMNDAKIADALGLVDRTTVTRYLKGRTPMSLPCFLDMCRAMDLDPVAVMQDARDG